MTQPMTQAEVRRQVEAALAALLSLDGVEQVDRDLSQWRDWLQLECNMDLRIRVELDRCYRLLEMDVVQWRTARSPAMQQQRCQQMRLHLGQMLHLLSL
ncbi:MAG: hypothetical protein HC919_07535 [Oscillatoriales cyanobacterium SM2_2_1]|nr:hypothetical protein [Oscillatoriales cyanobacterium SM2_2_1]